MANFTESKESRFGQFNTEDVLVRYVLNVVDGIKPLKGLVLEPSIGTGNFLDGLDEYGVFTDGCEVDPEIYVERKNDKVETQLVDFLKFQTDRNYDFIIGNPPYIELPYSFYSTEEQEEIKKQYGFLVDGRLNLVHIFLHKCMQLVAEDGVIAFLLPSVILTSPSYAELRRLILESFGIVHLEEKLIFEGVQIKVCLLVLRKGAEVSSFVVDYGNGPLFIESYTDYPHTAPTLDSLGYKISVGNLLWYEMAGRMLDEETDASQVLLYSNNIKKGEISLNVNLGKDPEKKQFLHPRLMTVKNCVVLPRTIQPGKVRFALIKDNTQYQFENHVLVVQHDSVEYLEKLSDYLASPQGEKAFALFTNSVQLTASEIQSLPILEYKIEEFIHELY